MIYNNFSNENNNYLKFILNERFFKTWKTPFIKTLNNEYDRSLYSDSHLELYITAKCNQKCEYCYLHKYEHQLYPINNNDPEKIIENLKILLNFLIENNFFVSALDLFSGEIWHTKFGWDILEIIYEACLNGLNIDKVLIPSNCSFIRDEQAFFKIQNLIDKFAGINKKLIFSISVDGKIIEEDNRPLNSNENKNDDFYDLLFGFAAHNGFGFHPMLAAYSIEKWIDNYNWYKAQCEKYNINFFKNVMILEVRNDDWTPEKLKYYKKFLEYYFYDLKNSFPKDLQTQELMHCLFYDSASSFLGNGYHPIVLSESDTFASCTVADTLTVRLGDLAICPCHRLAYDELLYGHFVVEENKITDIIANNIYTPTRILLANNNLTSFKCDTCVYNQYCLKGCFGSQYETVKDPFLPIDSVCEMFKTKINTLIDLYKQNKLIDELEKCPPAHIYYVKSQSFLRFVKEVEQNENNQFYKQNFS